MNVLKKEKIIELLTLKIKKVNFFKVTMFLFFFLN